MSETIEATISSETAYTEDRLAGWTPVSGEETRALLTQHSSLSDEAQTTVRRQALGIVARCGDPRQEGPRAEAHLVVGEVQSGKTLSFTTAIALARDNDFPLVVVLGGTKTNLLHQTEERFQQDLGADDGRPPAFRPFVAGEYELSDLRNSLRAAAKLKVPKKFRATVVIFVLKHAGRLNALAADLRSIVADLPHLPALIIDDEADQAGMNVARGGRESPVYAAIAELRRALPRSDMLMYTATPQAPLLMNVSDQWAPATVAVLTSGEGYIGGQHLFVDGRDDFVEIIPDHEIATALDPNAQDPPPSLRKAILFYLLAWSVTQESSVVHPLSMLIHPAAARDLHRKYERWTRSIVDSVGAAVDDLADVAAADLEEELTPLWEDLARTARPLPLTLREAMERIDWLLAGLSIKVVNSSSNHEIAPADWRKSPGWIVIGGNKLDRGFTIENLAVTYMPRGRGQGTVDTIQQRGRFFGYKARYAGFLRGWFNAETAEAFELYVTHERSIAEGLKEVEQTSMPLRTWRRSFLLDPRYKPTRASAVKLSLRMLAPLRRDGWYVPRHPYSPEIAEPNLETFKRLLRAAGTLTTDPNDPRPSGNQHMTAVVRRDDVLPLLFEWQAIGQDAHRLSALELGLVSEAKLEQLDEVRLIFMDGHVSFSDPAQMRRRRLRARDELTLFQGRAPAGPYPGDAAFFDPERITVQLHLLRLERDGKVVASPVAALAVHLDAAPALFLES